MHLPPLRHLAAATLLACATLSAQAQVATGTMTTPRMYHQANALADGRILVTGGAASPSAPLLDSTEAYDPVTGTFAPLPPMLVAKREHAAVTLKDGRVLVAGGMVPNGSVSSFAEIFDPATGQWTATAPMNTGYYRTMALLLADGRVMVAARDTTGHHAEIFDPVKGSFSKSGDMIETTDRHGMIALADGRVLKMGGVTVDGKYSRNAEIWDPATNQWSATGAMSVERLNIQPALLPDGKVLVAGGHGLTKLISSEIYDPATGKFSPGTDLAFAFEPDTSTVLGDGTIVFTDPSTNTLFQYEPPSGAWNTAGFRRDTVHGASASRLPDGGLLLAGGALLDNASNYAAVLGQDCTGKQAVLDPAMGTVEPDGGSVLFHVQGTPGCRVGTSNMPTWLKVAPYSALSLGENGGTVVLFTAGGNMTGAARSASFYLANALATVSQEVSPTCPSVPYVMPGEIKLNSTGGAGTAAISAPAACSWQISGLPSFVTVTSATSGKGSGNLSYSASANPGNTARIGSATITAQGQSNSFTFTQDAPSQCPSAPTVSLSSNYFPAAGGTISATVKAAQYCQWSVGGLPSWAKLSTGGKGMGNGSFTLTASANNGAMLSTQVKVLSTGFTTSFSLFQYAGPCGNWGITPYSVSVSGSGANGSFTLNSPAGCAWTVSAPSWITITGASSGYGSSVITYTVAPNTGSSRYGSISLTGTGGARYHSVSQAAQPVPAP